MNISNMNLMIWLMTEFVVLKYGNFIKEGLEGLCTVVGQLLYGWEPNETGKFINACGYCIYSKRIFFHIVNALNQKH